jgi:hypothetical protein
MADQASLYTTTRAITLDVLAVHGASEPDHVSKFGVTHEMLDGSLAEQIAGGRRDMSIDFHVMTALQRRQVVDWWLDPARELRSLATIGTVTIATGGAGGSLTGGTTYYYRVCAIDVIGHSALSNEVSREAGAGGEEPNLQIRISWTAVAGARGYKVYRKAAVGGTYYLYDYTTDVTYLDSGTITAYRVETAPAAASHIHVITTNELEFTWGFETELNRLLHLELREASIFTAAAGFPV